MLNSKLKAKIIALAIVLPIPVSVHALDWIAHRGNACSSPENSLQAIEDSWRLGADGVEIDVRFSADGVAYLFHDKAFRGKKMLDLEYSQIVSLIGERLAPELDSALAIPASGYYLLDLKETRVDDIPILQKSLSDSNIRYEQVIIQSSDVKILSELQKRIGHVRLAYLSKLKRVGIANVIPNPMDIINPIKHLDIKILSIKGRRFLNAEYLKALKSAGQEVFVWTINRKERAAFYRQIGINGVITDNLAAFVGDRAEC